MKKGLQRILDMPYSKLIPQVSDNPKYYDRMIHVYEAISKMTDKEIIKNRETKEIIELKETMNRYIKSARLQKKSLEMWGAGLLTQ